MLYLRYYTAFVQDIVLRYAMLTWKALHHSHLVDVAINFVRKVFSFKILLKCCTILVRHFNYTMLTLSHPEALH